MSRLISRKYFFYFSLLGSFYLFLEAGLQVSGRSICVSDGCGLAARMTRFGDLPTILIGFLALGLMTLLSGINLRRPRGWVDSVINLALVAALAAEGFFVGYQIFWLPEVCLFCLTVFGIFLILGLLRLFEGWKEISAGFAAFVLILGLIGLTFLPPGRALPANKKIILFYSEDCRHCREIKEEIDQTKLDITPVLVHDYRAALDNLGIHGVPTLLVNGPNERLLLTGKEAIRRYFAACKSSEKSTPFVSVAPPLNKRSLVKPSVSGPQVPLSPWGAPNPSFNPSADEGLCKENQKCD